MSKKIQLAIFASGSGTNAENICNFFTNKRESKIVISELFCNKSDAFVLERARKLGLKSTVFTKEDFKNPDFVKKMQDIDYIVLAGFLWLIPPYLIQAFPNRIINMHPSLLPKFGGKGMYGDHVHRAVIEARETESGITIHLVNEEYDKGKILFQAKCDVTPRDTPESLAQKIHALEYLHVPEVIENYIESNRGLK